MKIKSVSGGSVLFFPILMMTILTGTDVSGSSHIPVLKEGQEWVFEERNKYSYNAHEATSSYDVLSVSRKTAVLEGDTVLPVWDQFRNCKVINVYETNGSKTPWYFWQDEDDKIYLVYWQEPQPIYPTGSSPQDGMWWPEEACWFEDICLNPYPSGYALSDFVYIGEHKVSRWYIRDNGRYNIIDGVGQATFDPMLLKPRGHFDALVEVHVPGWPEPVLETDFYRGVPFKGMLGYELESDYGGINMISAVCEWPEMLRTDRVWVYGGVDPADNSYYESYCRFGDWQREGCCYYRPFYEYKRITWPDKTNPSLFTVSEGGTFPPVLLRENMGRVHFPNDEDVSTKNIYDFNLHIEDCYHNTAYNFPVVDTSDFSVAPGNLEWSSREISEIEIDGQIRRRQVYTTASGTIYEFIEGIGVINRGFLPYIYGEGEDATVPCLLRYCDDEESPLYVFHDNPVVEVQQVAGIEKNTGIYYDFNGQTILNPLPGNMYIRNGKKIIFSGKK